jgi:ATP synthase protein I
MANGMDLDGNSESINYPRFRRSEEGVSPVNIAPATPSEPAVPEAGVPETEALPASESVLLSVESDNSMQEYETLKRDLYIVTLVLMGIIALSVWFFYSLNTTINYVLGAISGIVYLRMLARDVDNLSRDNNRLSKTRFALFIGLMVVATQWHQLQILPIFLGFLTYKATLLLYVLPKALLPEIKSSR